MKIFKIMALLILTSLFARTDIVESTNEVFQFQYYPDGSDANIAFICPDANEGDPEIEYRFLKIGIPAGSVPEIEILNTDYYTGESQYIEPLGRAVNTEKNSSSQPFESSIYSKNVFFPDKWVIPSEIQSIRGRHFVSLYIPKYRWNPVSKEKQLLKKIEIRVSWDVSNEVKRTNDPQFDNFFEAMLVNNVKAKSFAQSLPKTSTKEQNPFDGSTWHSFRIKGNGIYSISYEALHGILDNAIPSSQIGVFMSNPEMLPVELQSEIPAPIPVGIVLEDGGDGEFGPGDNLLLPIFGTSGEYRDEGGVFRGYINYFDTLTSIWIALGDDDYARAQTTDFSHLTPDTFLTSSWTFTHTEKLVKANEGLWYWDDVSDYSFYTTEPERISQDVSPNFYVLFNPMPQIPTLNGNTMHIGTMPIFAGTTFAGDASSTDANRVIAHFSSTVNFKAYQKLYRIYLKPESGSLRFASNDSGSCEYFLTGFTQPIVWDITNFETQRILQTVSSDQGFSFIDTLAFREYLVVEKSSVQEILPEITLTDDAGSLWESNTGADYLILTPKEFDVSKLVSFRESYSDFRVEVVYLEDIYRDFGMGNPDPIAVRNFLSFAYANWESPAPSYVLLVGDSHYDYMNKIHHEPIHFPLAYEVPNSSRLPMAYSGVEFFSDEFFVTLDGLSGPEMLIGRFSAKSQDDVNIMIDKTIDYESNPEYGFWRVEIMTIADDEYKGRTEYETRLEHTTNQSMLLESKVSGNWDPIALYQIDYATNSQMKKPTVTEDIFDKGLDGVFYMNYIGHGSQLRWAHEDVFNLVRDIPRFMVGDRLPFVTSFSCDVARYFLTWTECMAEEMVRMEGGGAIGVLAATAGSYSGPNKAYSRRFFEHVFRDEIPSTFAGASYATKASYYPGHDAQYILFGDPAIEFPYPEHIIEISCPDTLIGKKLFTLSGRVVSSTGEFLSDYNGNVMVKIRDAEFTRFYESPIPAVGSANYIIPGVPIYFGTSAIVNGEFEVSLIVPADVFIDRLGGSILAYAWNEQTDAVGSKTDLFVTRSTAPIDDNQGPEITLYFNSPAWTPGEKIGRNPILCTELSDESGINITGLNGHEIAVYFDDNSVDMIDLTSSFKYNPGSYTLGKLEKKLNDLSIGQHNLTFIAWDNLGNSSNYRTDFEVSETSNSIFDVLPYPSPFKEQTEFTFGITDDAEITISIHTLSGKKIRTLKGNIDTFWSKIRWDGRDSNNNEIANGTYLYVVKADFGDTTVEFLGKISKIK